MNFCDVDIDDGGSGQEVVIDFGDPGFGYAGKGEPDFY
jgi:hypothetical protein